MELYINNGDNNTNYVICTNIDVLNINGILNFQRKEDKTVCFNIKYCINELDNHNIYNNIKSLQFYENYEGCKVTVFYYDNNWYRLIDPYNDSNHKIINILGKKNEITINNIFDDILQTKKIDIEKLRKDYIYTFTLIHHKYKYLIHYPFGNDYREIILSCVQKLDGSLVSINNVQEIMYDNNCNNNLNIRLPNQYYFSSYEEFKNIIEKINHDNVISKRITTAGFNIHNLINNTITTIQLNIYKELSQLRSQYRNCYELYLDLYQKNRLNALLPYMSRYSNEIIHRINTSMKTLSKELLNIYHVTRHKNNRDLYDILTEQYKKILYDIHGIYIKKRKNINIINNNDYNIHHNNHDLNDQDYISKGSITIHDVYYYIKSLHINQLKQLYHDRVHIIETPFTKEIMNHNCIYTLTLSKLLSDNN